MPPHLISINSGLAWVCIGAKLRHSCHSWNPKNLEALSQNQGQRLDNSLLHNTPYHLSLCQTFIIFPKCCFLLNYAPTSNLVLLHICVLQSCQSNLTKKASGCCHSLKSFNGSLIITKKSRLLCVAHSTLWELHCQVL